MADPQNPFPCRGDRDRPPGIILAAVDYANGKTKIPPPELRDYEKVTLFGIGLRAGGVDDQPIGRMNRMIAASNAYLLVMRYKAEQEARKGVKKPRPMPTGLMNEMAKIWRMLAKRDEDNA